MTAPAVSVVVPLYNGEAHIAETIESVLAQTFADFELLIIDDGSQDSSAAVVRRYNDPRLRLVQKENGGLCDALNRGIAEAAAPYLARCDQDDICFPERLAKQLAVFTANPQTQAVFAYTTKFGGKNRWNNADKAVMQTGLAKPFEPLRDGCLLGSTMLARTDFLRELGGYRAAYYPSDDWDLELRMSDRGSVMVLQEPVVAYRFHASANTYRTFATMNERTRWAEDSWQRRAHSQPELSVEDFRASQPKDLRTRLRRGRKDLGKLRLRKAGHDYLDGRYVSAIANFAMGSLLHPVDIVRRVKRVIRGKLLRGDKGKQAR